MYDNGKLLISCENTEYLKSLTRKLVQCMEHEIDDLDNAKEANIDQAILGITQIIEDLDKTENPFSSEEKFAFYEKICELNKRFADYVTEHRRIGEWARFCLNMFTTTHCFDMLERMREEVNRKSAT